MKTKTPASELMAMESKYKAEIIEARQEAKKTERYKIINLIKNDNRSNGMYSGLAQFTNGYDAAIKRVLHLIEETMPMSMKDAIENTIKNNNLLSK